MDNLTQLTSLGHWGKLRQLSVSRVAFTALDSAPRLMCDELFPEVCSIVFIVWQSIYRDVVVCIKHDQISGLLSCLCCSFCLLAERTSELLPQIQLVLHTSYQAAETWMNHGHWPSAFCAFQMHFNMFAQIFSSCSPCLKVIITLE